LLAPIKYFFSHKIIRIKDALIYPNRFDDLIPFKPHCIWIYSFIYYPFIVSIVLAVNSMEDFIYVCISFMLLVFIHVGFFFMFPVKTPCEWRDYDATENSFLTLWAELSPEKPCLACIYWRFKWMRAAGI